MLSLRLFTHCLEGFCPSAGLYGDELCALQGFTKKITLPRDVYTGFIKEYDGVTLMEFVIHPLINYSQVAPTIRTQRAALAERLRSISNSHIIHAPLGTEGVPFVPVDPMDIEGSFSFCTK